jgi:hypothetical protein
MEPGKGFVWILERRPYRVYCCFHICLSCCFLFISVTCIGAWPHGNEIIFFLISAALEMILLHFCLLTESNILWYSLIYVRKSLVITLSLFSWFYSIYHGSYLLPFSMFFNWYTTIISVICHLNRTIYLVTYFFSTFSFLSSVSHYMKQGDQLIIDPGQPKCSQTLTLGCQMTIKIVLLRDWHN